MSIPLVFLRGKIKDSFKKKEQLYNNLTYISNANFQGCG